MIEQKLNEILLEIKSIKENCQKDRDIILDQISKVNKANIEDHALLREKFDRVFLRMAEIQTRIERIEDLQEKVG